MGKKLGIIQLQYPEQCNCLFAAKEVMSNVHTAPEVWVMSVGDDKNYAAEAEHRDNAGLLGLKEGLKESLEVVTCLKPVNEDGKGSRFLFKI